MATQRELAAHLGISRETARKLRRDGVLPEPRRGRAGYDLDACRLAYLEHLRERAAGREQPGNITEARIRFESARARREELKLGKEQGDLVTVKDAAIVAEEFALEVRGMVRSLPGRIARRIAGMTDVGQIERAMRNEIEQAFREFAAEGDEGEG